MNEARKKGRQQLLKEISEIDEWLLNRDPVSISEKLYYTTLKIGVDASREAFAAKNYKLSNDLLQNLVPIAACAYDALNVIKLHLLLANNEFQRRNFDKAVKHCELVLQVNEDYSSPIIQAAALTMQSDCLMLMFEHEKAMQSLKALLELAW